MIIHKDYTTLNLLFNEPCDIDDKCYIYPISLKDYSKFSRYIKYIAVSKKQLKIKETDDFLQSLLIAFMIEKAGSTNLLDENVSIALKEVITDFEYVFSTLTKKKIKAETYDKGFIFKGEGICIDDSNFETIRDVVAKMCLIKEPKVFDDPLMQKWYQKALIAKQSNTPKIDFEDIVVIVSQDMKMSISEILEMNIFQLNCYYQRILQRDNYDKCMNFKLVSDKVPNANFSDKIIEKLYVDDDSDLFAGSADSILS